MGKRELLLIVAFVVVGAIVYQATAPPPGPNERGFSLSRIVDHIRREMRGNRARAEETKVTRLQLDATTTEIRISGHYVELSVTGENRPDVEARFYVTSTGYDEAEAKSFVAQTELLVDRAGPVLQMTSNYPHGGRQQAKLTLLVPNRLLTRIDQGSPRTSILNVAEVEIPTMRGETSIKHIPGRVTLTHRGGQVAIEDVATLKLTTRGTEVTVVNVKGDAWFSLQSGEVTATSLLGPIEIESQSASVTLRKLEETRGPIRVNAVGGGSLALDGLSTEARIESRDVEVDIIMAKAAPVSVYSEGDEPIEFTPPPGGFTLDALVNRGRISLPQGFDSRITVVAVKDTEQRANGSVRGGGPTITLRANRGDVRIRSREAKMSQR